MFVSLTLNACLSWSGRVNSTHVYVFVCISTCVLDVHVVLWDGLEGFLSRYSQAKKEGSRVP